MRKSQVRGSRVGAAMAARWRLNPTFMRTGAAQPRNQIALDSGSIQPA
jgi:hypothetical protein